MHIDQHGTACAFSQVPAGTVFRFGLRDQCFIALKSFEQLPGGNSIDYCAVLAPGHPGYDGSNRPGIFAASVVDRYPVFSMPEVHFVISQDDTDWTIGTGVDIQPGMVLLTQPRAMLAVAANQSTACVDLASGKIIRDNRELPITVNRWSLVLVHFDRPTVLFEREGNRQA
jgi:hypothetical protein